MEHKSKTIIEKPYFADGSYFDSATTNDQYSLCSHYEIKFSENIVYDITESVVAIVEREVAKARAHEREKMSGELKSAKKTNLKFAKIFDILTEDIDFCAPGGQI